MESVTTTSGDAIIRVYLYGGGRTVLENWNEKTNAIEDKHESSEGPHYLTL